MSIKLLHGKEEKQLIFQKFWKRYNLDYSELLGEARKIVSDVKFFSEFIKRTKKSHYNFSMRINDFSGFMRNLDERYGYYPYSLEDEDVVFRIITSEIIIKKLVAEMDYDGITEFNKFTKAWFGFDIFKKYGIFLGSAHLSGEFEKGLEVWRKNKGEQT